MATQKYKFDGLSLEARARAIEEHRRTVVVDLEPNVELIKDVATCLGIENPSVTYRIGGGQFCEISGVYRYAPDWSAKVREIIFAHTRIGKWIIAIGERLERANAADGPEYDQEEVKAAMAQLSETALEMLLIEYNYRLSDEGIAEFLRASGAEFTEDGIQTNQGVKP